MGEGISGCAGPEPPLGFTHSPCFETRLIGETGEHQSFSGRPVCWTESVISLPESPSTRSGPQWSSGSRWRSPEGERLPACQPARLMVVSPRANPKLAWRFLFIILFELGWCQFTPKTDGAISLCPENQRLVWCQLDKFTQMNEN